MEGRESLEKEAGHSRLGGGSFHQQGSLPRRPVVGATEEQISVPACHISELYRGLHGFSHSHCPDGLICPKVSLGCLFENGSQGETPVEHAFQAQEGGVQPHLLGPILRSIYSHILWMGSFNKRTQDPWILLEPEAILPKSPTYDTLKKFSDNDVKPFRSYFQTKQCDFLGKTIKSF